MNLIFSGQKILVASTVTGISLPEDEQIETVQYQCSLIQVKLSNVKLVARLMHEDNLPTGLQLVNLRFALNSFSVAQCSAIIYAQQIIHYLEQNKFCSICGSHLVINLEKNWLSCTLCQREIYPTISPAMIVAVRRGSELLMAQAHHYAADNWGLLAGYLEVGESLEDCVRREVYEEVGIQIQNIRYWGSQYWPFPHSLMVGFIADYASGEIVVDHSELRCADFFDVTNLPGFPSARTSIAQKIIDEIVNFQV